MNFEKVKLGIIGLGYVGLPIAVEFGKNIKTIGFDISETRINELLSGKDRALEVDVKELLEAKKLSFSSNIEDILDCNIYIVTVPTPINNDKKPDLSHLINATSVIGGLISNDDIVIFESTVYPGATEEICVPILEQKSGLKFNRDFFCGYSPERINPGDKEHRLTDIHKLTSGSTEQISILVDDLYNSIISAGTTRVSSIKVAEAAKVIENTQRDVNIALVNEFALIFNKLSIDTQEVLAAASTKWNFLDFRPGLVGGHCIGVDPYYLTYKALEVGYKPKMILAGRELNENMGSYVSNQVKRLMTQKQINVVDSKILILGFSFKENCPDSRNTRVVDIMNDLMHSHCNVDIYDPWVNSQEVYNEYGIQIVNKPETGCYDAVIIAVAHDEFKKMKLNGIKSLCNENHVIYDVKHILDKSDADGRL